jgi:hypothetical protein
MMTVVRLWLRPQTFPGEDFGDEKEGISKSRISGVRSAENRWKNRLKI